MQFIIPVLQILPEIYICSFKESLKAGVIKSLVILAMLVLK